jgi:hypothetical protein
LRPVEPRQSKIEIQLSYSDGPDLEQWNELVVLDLDGAVKGTDGPAGRAASRRPVVPAGRRTRLRGRIRDRPRLAESTTNRTAGLQGFDRLATRGVLGGRGSNVRARRALLLVFGAGGLLMVASAANAANLFLSRSVSRRTDTAVRAALGGEAGGGSSGRC